MLDLYESRIRDLTAADKRRLVDLITRELSESAAEEHRQTSILELRGLGRHLWSDTDATDYVSALRDEWTRRP